MVYEQTYDDGCAFLDEVEGAVERISLDSLLSSLYYKAYDAEDVERMNAYLGICLAKMNEEYERLMRYRTEFLNTFATKDNEHYKKRSVLIGKMRTSLSKIKQLCQKFHIRAPKGDALRRKWKGIAVPSVYDSSMLTSASVTTDIFGLESYPDCVKTLFSLILRFRDAMFRIMILCRSIMVDEAEYRKDPERCNDILRKFRNKCMSFYNDVMDVVQLGKLTCTEELTKMRTDYPKDIAFAPVAYHNVTRSDMQRLVLKEACEERMRLGLSEEEQELWGSDVEKVKEVRKLIDQFDTLLPDDMVFRGNKLPARYVAMFMHWCGVKNWTGQVERTFVRYFAQRYLENGAHGMVDNSAVNKAKNSQYDWDNNPEYKKFVKRINIVKML